MKPKLTVLSHGMGQDSTAITELMINEPAFREEYAPNDLLIVFAETGDEHKETYEHLQRTIRRCLDKGLTFIHITPALGYHTGNWQSLRAFYRATNTVGSKAFPKTCTDRLKLVPIYKCLEDWIGVKYQLETGRKKGFYEFTKQYGKIDMLIGIAAGEEKRMADGSKDPHKWKRENINIRYPLIDRGLDRQGCQDTIAGYGQIVPIPSNCILCPFMSEQELLYMWRFLNNDYHEWVAIEQAKIDANLHKGEKNLGVWGKKLLPIKLIEATKKFGHMSNAELHNFKMSHGHCVMSKY